MDLSGLTLDQHFGDPGGSAEVGVDLELFAAVEDVGGEARNPGRNGLRCR